MPITSQQGTCCPNNFVGFCLENGTPIAVVIDGGTQTGWINILTGIFTAGPPPAGTVVCSESITISPLTCETDSITICPGDDPIIVVQQPLTCETDSVTVCPGDEPLIVVQQPLSCITDSVTVCTEVLTNAVVTRVNAATSSTNLLVALGNRSMALFWNDSSSTCYLKFGAGASTISFTWKLASNSGFELPSPIYGGLITAVWDAAVGAMQITELS